MRDADAASVRSDPRQPPSGHGRPRPDLIRGVARATILNLLDRPAHSPINEYRQGTGRNYAARPAFAREGHPERPPGRSQPDSPAAPAGFLPSPLAREGIPGIARRSDRSS